jgi:hypothetical protein
MTSISSISKIKTEFGGIPVVPFGPYASADGMSNLPDPPSLK